MQLVGMTYSPWTECARWALDHHHLAYELVEHQPVLGELALRLRLRRWSGRVTVPVLHDGAVRIDDSLDIVRHADAVGRGTKLLPPADEREILAVWASCQRLLDAGRGMVVRATAADPAALRAATPRFVPAPLRVPLGRFGTWAFAAKYGLHRRDRAHDLAEMRGALGELSARVGPDTDTLLPTFTFADVALACALQAVAPVDGRHLRLTPEQRAVWGVPELAAEQPGLLAYRDRIWERHRR